MNRSTFALTAILAAGTVGCAGLGNQQTSTLATHRGGTIGEPGRGLGDLWDAEAQAPNGLHQTVAAKNTGSDLWNPAAVARSWETDSHKPEPRGLLSSAYTDLKF